MAAVVPGTGEHDGERADGDESAERQHLETLAPTRSPPHTCMQIADDATKNRRLRYTSLVLAHTFLRTVADPSARRSPAVQQEVELGVG